MNIDITLYRINRAPRQFREGFLEDDGICLRTLTPLPEEFRVIWSEGWQSWGAIAPGTMVTSVRKYFFYSQYFSIMELCGAQDERLGYYADICTPLAKLDEGYACTDLLLDLYVWPDGRYRILDLEEFEAVVQANRLSPELAAKALETLYRLVKEVESGEFPTKYTTPVH
jgi:protein associated with RNAse G/E